MNFVPLEVIHVGVAHIIHIDGKMKMLEAHTLCGALPTTGDTNVDTFRARWWIGHTGLCHHCWRKVRTV